MFYSFKEVRLQHLQAFIEEVRDCIAENIDTIAEDTYRRIPITQVSNGAITSIRDEDILIGYSCGVIFTFKAVYIPAYRRDDGYTGVLAMQNLPECARHLFGCNIDYCITADENVSAVQLGSRAFENVVPMREVYDRFAGHSDSIIMSGVQHGDDSLTEVEDAYLVDAYRKVRAFHGVMQKFADGLIQDNGHYFCIAMFDRQHPAIQRYINKCQELCRTPRGKAEDDEVAWRLRTVLRDFGGLNEYAIDDCLHYYYVGKDSGWGAERCVDCALDTAVRFYGLSEYLSHFLWNEQLENILGREARHEYSRTRLN